MSTLLSLSHNKAPRHRSGSYLYALLLLMAVLGSSVTLTAQTASPAIRITGDISNAQRVPLPGTRHPLAEARYESGRVPAATRLEGMAVVFSRTQAQQSDLTKLIEAQQDHSSPLYHKWLTPDEFAVRFGLAQADITKVSVWLEQQGFSVDSVARSRNRIKFSGTIGQVEAAFGTELHYYTFAGEKHFASSKPASIPAALSGVVADIGNLHSFQPKPMLHKSPNLKATPDFTSGSSGHNFVSPADAATIYDLTQAYNSGVTGSGQSIAILGQSAIHLSDIGNFQKASGWANPKDPILVLVPGSGTDAYSAGDEAESDLDLEWSSTMAPAVEIFFVHTGNNTNYGVYDSLQYAVDERIAPIVSLSYGGCEAVYSASDISTIESINQQGAAQGQTLVASSGDDGASGCYRITSWTMAQRAALVVGYPASSPYFTAVGGTQFNEGSGSYWSTTSGTDIISSALSYIPEAVWNEDIAGSLGSSGGGVSMLFSKPSWQTGVPGIPADGVRDVPDVSLASAGSHDGLLFCTSDSSFWSSTQTSSCSSGFRDASSNALTVAGGTSFAAPMFAGIVALINQAENSTGQGVLNPKLYQLASDAAIYNSAFHDITVGDNTCSSTDTVSTCPNGATGYYAAPGYDLATGIGTVDGYNLIQAWGTPTLAGTITQLSASTLSPSASKPVQFTVNVSSRSGSGTPTGTVAITIDGVAASSLQLTNGSATYSATITGTGNHILVATYSGDTTYAGSTMTLSMDSVIQTTALIYATTTTPLVGKIDNFDISIVRSSGLDYPSGSVSILVDGTTVTPSITLSSNGHASYSTAFLTAGTHTVGVSYPGSVAFQPSDGSITLNVLQPAPIVTTTKVSAANAQPYVGASDSFSISVTPASGTTVPSGAVSITVDGVASATTPTLTNGVATFTTAFQTSGTHTVAATYAATTTFAGSSSSATVTVPKPGFALSTATVSVSQGSSATASVTLTPANGYTGTVAFTLVASPLLSNACYSLPSATASSTGAVSSTFTITTNQAACPAGSVQPSVRRASHRASASQPSTPFPMRGTILASVGVLPGVLIAGLFGASSRKQRMLAALTVLVALCFAVSGCGGSSHTANVTPKGTYSLTVTGTDTTTSAITSSTTFTLNVN